VKQQLQISAFKLSQSKQLLILCALVQFLACVLIHLCSCEIRSLAYFQNYIYACALFGLGLGCLSFKDDRNVSSETGWLIYFMVSCLLLAGAHLSGCGDLGFLKERSTYFILPTFLPNQIQHELLIIAMFLSVFFLVTRGFKSLGKQLGKRIDAAAGSGALFQFFAGSALGWLLFAVTLWLRWPPLIAVAFVLAGFVALHGINLIQMAMVAVCCVSVLSFDTVKEPKPIADAISKYPDSVSKVWAPAYRVLTYPIVAAGKVYGFVVKVNGGLFQPGIYSRLDRNVADQLAPVYGDYLSSIIDYYKVPGLAARTKKKVLVLGSGAGNDVAQALAEGAELVDAVEGQDWLLELASFNPESPYKSPKVRRIAADPRTFLRFSNQKYDLIIYSILESQTAFSPFGSLRPDNLVYTVESFIDASDHLSDGGVLAVSYFPVRGWYGLRLTHNLKLAHLTVDADLHTGFRNYLICSRTGNRPAVEALEGALPEGSIRDSKKLKKEIEDVDPTSDDWPFAFLATGSMPFAYLFCLTLVLLTVIFETCAIQRANPPDELSGDEQGRSGRDRIGLLGLACAFMLACDKAMSTNAFNFGSLWTVSVLSGAAFFIVAASASIPAIVKVRIPLIVFWLLLFLSIAGDFFFNYAALVSIPQSWMRAAISGILPVLPLFFLASLMTRQIVHSRTMTVEFAFVLLGCSIGLMLDAIAMYRGISGLYVAVGLISAVSLVLIMFKPKTADCEIQGVKAVNE
jgi:hypothetical protein